MTESPEPADVPGKYEHLEFIAPLSPERADRFARSLAAAEPRVVLDVGCGFAGLLLRVVAAAPTASGTGYDVDAALLDRGRRNAQGRGLADRVTLIEATAAAIEAQSDVVICIGADHIFHTDESDGQRAALAALRRLVRPGGRVLFGSGFWAQPPTPEQAGAVGMEPDDLRELAGLVELAIECGFRPLSIETASVDEWQVFESGFLADWEEWLVRNSNHPDANDVRARADTHRTEWLRGYGAVLGFAYLVLGVPTA